VTVRRAAASLALVGVVGAVGVGCASQDRPEGHDRHDQGSSRAVTDRCSSSIDAQIASREIPNSDRDYFFTMCELNR
jgi:hypothetical protein